MEETDDRKHSKEAVKHSFKWSAKYFTTATIDDKQAEEFYNRWCEVYYR